MVTMLIATHSFKTNGIFDAAFRRRLGFYRATQMQCTSCIARYIAFALLPRCSVEKAEGIELVFGREATFDLHYTAL